MEVAKPKVVVNTNVEIDYGPRKLVVKDKDRRWVAIVERKGKKLSVDVWVRRQDGELEEVDISELGNPLELLSLDLSKVKELRPDLEPEEVRSGIGLALANWDKEVRRQEAQIALSDISVIPDRVTDKETLAYEIAKRIVEKHGATGLKLEVSGDVKDLGIYCYDRAWYFCESMFEEWIGSFLQELQKVRFTKNLLEEVKAKVRLLSSRTVRAGSGVMLSFENGVLDVECFIASGDFRKCIRQHDPDLYVFHHLPHQLDLKLLEEVRRGLELYIPPRDGREVLAILKALSPRVYEYLRSLTYFEGVDPDVHESRVLFLLEMFGRGLVPGYSLFGTVVGVFKNIFLVVGLGDTGKSTMLRNFYGDLVLTERNYSLTNLGKLGSSDPDTVEKELGKLALKNPLVAMHLDLGKNVKVRDWSFIRQVSGGDPVPARRLFRDSFDYRPAWKIYLSTNDPPPIREEGPAKEALLNRFRAIEFRNVFKDVLDVKSYFTKRDIEVVLVASLYAVRLVYERGGYSFTGIRDIEDLLNRYTYPEYRVVMELVEVGRLEFDPALEIASRDLYDLCVSYVNEVVGRASEEEREEVERRYSLPDQTRFTKNLKKLLAKYGVKTKSESHYTVFKGIGVKRGKGLV